MKFTGFVDRDFHGWPPPGPAVGIRVDLDVEPDSSFEDAAKRIIRQAGFEPKDYYYWPQLIEGDVDGDFELVAFPRVVIAGDGEFTWTQAARDRVLIGDLLRTKEAGLSRGDPTLVYLERPGYGDGVLPGWEDFISWTIEFAYLGGLALLIGVVKKHFKHWQDRGASGPLAYLDLVVTRDTWDIRDVKAWFALGHEDAVDMLTGLGFAPTSEDSNVWVVSPDPRYSELRRKINDVYLHRAPEEDDGT